MERRSRSFLQLIKPGITLSNTLMAVAGYFLAASVGGFSLATLLATMVGVSAIIASACVCNNILDRGRDARMARTARRVLVEQSISLPVASVYALSLAVIGFTSLVLWTNMLTAALGVVAFSWYVVVYGLAKRVTTLNTVIGGVAGALPPVAGYTALSDQIDSVAIMLFLLMFVWQMPHFYAIAIFRAKDYSQAGFLTWTNRFGVASTKRQMLFFIALFVGLSPVLFVLGYVGYVYAAIMSFVGLYWLGLALRDGTNHTAWARRVFGGSFIVLMALCVSIAVGGYLP